MISIDVTFVSFTSELPDICAQKKTKVYQKCHKNDFSCKTSLKVNSVLEREPILPILTSMHSNLIYFDNGSMIQYYAIKTIKSYQNCEKAIKKLSKL